MLSITIVDAGDRASMTLRMNVNKALAKAGIKADVIVIDATRGYRISNVDRIPALLINGEVVAQGESLKAGEIADELIRREDLANGQTFEVSLPCGGCKRNCDLRRPQCSTGVEKARRLGVR